MFQCFKLHYVDTWDVDVVLTFLENMPDNPQLDDSFLTWKLSMLLALTGALRASELALLDVEFMSDQGTSISFTLPGLTKTRSKTHPKCVKIDFHEFTDNPSLDVTACIRNYILRTSQWRVSKSHHKLLLATTKPHNPVATSTISGWLLRVMEVAGLDVSKYKAHSTRAASTSKVRVKGMWVIFWIGQIGVMPRHSGGFMIGHTL